MNGVYVLIIRLKESIDLKVGALGVLHFKKGYYAYVGSAQNSAENRIKRHLRKHKKLFWHIDYLLENDDSEIAEVLFMQGRKAMECQIVCEIERKSEPVRGFGFSDCRCVSHMFKIKDYCFLRKRMSPLNW